MKLRCLSVWQFALMGPLSQCVLIHEIQVGWYISQQIEIFKSWQFAFMSPLSQCILIHEIQIGWYLSSDTKKTAKVFLSFTTFYKKLHFFTLNILETLREQFMPLKNLFPPDFSNTVFPHMVSAAIIRFIVKNWNIVEYDTISYFKKD